MLDLAFITVGMVIFGVVLLMAYKFSSGFNDQIQTNPVFTDEGRAASAQVTALYPGVLDNSVLFIIIGLSVVTLITASMVRVHPIFIPIFLFFWVFLIIMAAIFSNFYEGFHDAPVLSDVSQDFTFLPLVLLRLPWFIAVIGMILMIVMYKTWSNSQL